MQRRRVSGRAVRISAERLFDWLQRRSLRGCSCSGVIDVGLIFRNRNVPPAYHNGEGSAPCHASTVQLSGLCKRFGSLEAVSDVSFEVYPGEVFGLLGPNGAGKTTTIRMMLDIFRPDCGDVRVFGKKLDEAAKNRIGYMPEERGLYRDLKLEPTLLYLATLKGMDESAARAR